MSEFQMALLFPFIPFLVLIVLEIMLPNDDNDNDDDFDGGVMTPVYSPPANPA